MSLSAASWAADDTKKKDDEKSSSVKAATVANGWAYKPVQDVTIPDVNQKQWVETPIDAFILAKLEENNIKPSPDAERATYIRRATLDAWGLLPTPEEVEAFEKDKSLTDENSVYGMKLMPYLYQSLKRCRLRDKGLK
ncbi:MAG: DUF1549 domain-containing protein [Chitinophagaceae bacterium]|nr:MAG: DUF1549 domain-containing protein [Chitinophagaceae bacterium]